MLYTLIYKDIDNKAEIKLINSEKYYYDKNKTLEIKI